MHTDASFKNATKSRTQGGHLVAATDIVAEHKHWHGHGHGVELEGCAHCVVR